jgi:hypothetical protein
MTSELDVTKKLMGALVRMKPKLHEDMKIRKTRGKMSNKKKISSTKPIKSRPLAPLTPASS